MRYPAWPILTLPHKPKPFFAPCSFVFLLPHLPTLSRTTEPTSLCLPLTFRNPQVKLFDERCDFATTHHSRNLLCFPIYRRTVCYLIFDAIIPSHITPTRNCVYPCSRQLRVKIVDLWSAIRSQMRWGFRTRKSNIWDTLVYVLNMFLRVFMYEWRYCPCVD